MDQPPGLKNCTANGAALEVEVRRPLAQVSDRERAFWRRAVELERRRLVARLQTATPVR
jgi:hypothetical protein